MNCLKSTPRTLISSQRASYKPLVSSRSPEFTVQIHTDSLLPSMPPTHSSVFRSKSSCVAPPLHRPKAEALTQLRSRARTWWHFLRDFLSLSHCSRTSWWDQCWHTHANSASKHLNNRKGCRMHWCNKNRTGLAWFRVKPSVATAFCGGWKIPLLINNPNVSIWSKRLKHSWAAACSNRDDTLQCPLHVAVPIYHCPRNPSAQATERKKKPTRDTLSTKTANILPQTPFQQCCRARTAPAVPRVRDLQPSTEKPQDAQTRYCCLEQDWDKFHNTELRSCWFV